MNWRSARVLISAKYSANEKLSIGVLLCGTANFSESTQKPRTPLGVCGLRMTLFDLLSKEAVMID
jgi:hypothetical protein